MNRPDRAAPAVASPATLAALEYGSALALFASEARTDLGRERLRSILPATSAPELGVRRGAYLECERLRLEAPLVPSLGEEVGELVRRATTLDPALSGAEILVVARFLRAASDAARRILAADPPCPTLAVAAGALADPRALIARIEQLLDKK